MKATQFNSIHFNSKKNKLIVVSMREGIVLYKISTDNKVEKMGSILNKKLTKKDNILDAQSKKKQLKYLSHIIKIN